MSYELQVTSYEYLTNNKKSMFLINCRIEGDRLLYDFGIFFPHLKQSQTLRHLPNQEVKVLLTKAEIVSKNTPKLNGELKLDVWN